jgi:hypothetical protein
MKAYGGVDVDSAYILVLIILFTVDLCEDICI